jgi:hypothetical protein
VTPLISGGPFMRRGTRTVIKFCACGCGKQVPPYISPTSNRVEGYPKFVPGHGAKDWGKRWAQRLKEKGHPRSKPIGTRSRAHNGYIKIKIAEGKWDYEHRVVANAPPDKLVHHINGNTSDNSPSNLEIMSPGDHTTHHLTITRWSKLYDACVECNSSERAHAGRGRCFRCWQRARAKEIGWPNRR